MKVIPVQVVDSSDYLRWALIDLVGLALAFSFVASRSLRFGSSNNVEISHSFLTEASGEFRF